MPQTTPPRTPSANVEGRGNGVQKKTPNENFEELTKRLLLVSQNEIKTEIDKQSKRKSEKQNSKGKSSLPD